MNHRNPSFPGGTFTLRWGPVKDLGKQQQLTCKSGGCLDFPSVILRPFTFPKLCPIIWCWWSRPQAHLGRATNKQSGFASPQTKFWPRGASNRSPLIASPDTSRFRYTSHSNTTLRHTPAREFWKLTTATLFLVRVGVGSPAGLQPI